MSYGSHIDAEPIAHGGSVAGQVGAIEPAPIGRAGCAEAVRGAIDEIIADHRGPHASHPGRGDTRRVAGCDEPPAAVRRHAR